MAHINCQIIASVAAPVNVVSQVDWATQASPSNSQWRGIAWNGSVFCTLCYTGSAVATSPDGVTWTVAPIALNGGLASKWSYLVWDGVNFIAVSESSTTGMFAYSPDGFTWTMGSLPNTSYRAMCCDASTGRVYLADPSSNKLYYKNNDTNTWSYYSGLNNFSAQIISMAAYNNVIVYCTTFFNNTANFAPTDHLLCFTGAGSANTITAYAVDSGTGSTILGGTGVFHNGTEFCLVSRRHTSVYDPNIEDDVYSFTNTLFSTSTDGVSWTYKGSIPYTNNPHEMLGVQMAAKTGSFSVAVSTNAATALSSTDSFATTLFRPITQASYTGVTFAPTLNKFVAVSQTQFAVGTISS